jgi:hypothetical protein
MFPGLAVLAQAPGQSAACLLEERRTFGAIDLAPHKVPPFTSGAALMRNIELSPASIDPASAVRKHPPLRFPPARTERHGQELLSTGLIAATHAWLTGSTAGRIRCGRPRLDLDRISCGSLDPVMPDLRARAD